MTLDVNRSLDAGSIPAASTIGNKWLAAEVMARSLNSHGERLMTTCR